MFAAPRGFSQRTTSFIASRRQGIHQMPLRRLTRMTILTTHNGKHPHRHRSIFPIGIASTYDNQNLPCTSRRTRVSNSCRALFRLLTSRDECHAAITNPLHSVKKPAAQHIPEPRRKTICLTIEIKNKKISAQKMVGLGRLELPTSRLSSARSNQLSYRPVSYRPNPRPTSCHTTPNLQHWWSRTGSNRRPPACKAGALPAELRPR